MSHTLRDNSDRPSPAATHRSEPFQAYFTVPVTGGRLLVARAGPPPEPGRPVVLGLHGMTGTHMVYRTLARELGREAHPLCVLAPDLRGRGQSASVTEPRGMAAHVADLVAVLDYAGADRAIVVGHSMGSNIAVRFAADHPERVAAVVLLDGGLPVMPEDVLSGEDDGEQHGLLDRFEAKFATVDEYMEYWRNHPALKNVWDEDIDAFARRDFVEDADGVRCIAKLESVRSDVADLMFDGLTWTAVTRVHAPVRLLRAERGLYDENNPMIPLRELEDFLRDHPHVSVEMVADVNHFTMLLGDGVGPHRVAATVTEFAALDSPGS